MEPTNFNPANDTMHHIPLSQTEPLHQYANIPNFMPAHPSNTSITMPPALSAGLFGLIVVGTGAMGANLHKVNNGDMTMSKALNNSLIKGAAGGVAAATATAASTTLTSGGIAGLAVILATATGVSYLLTK